MPLGSASVSATRFAASVPEVPQHVWREARDLARRVLKVARCVGVDTLHCVRLNVSHATLTKVLPLLKNACPALSSSQLTNSKSQTLQKDLVRHKRT